MLLIIENNNSINRIDRKLSKSIILFNIKINRDCSSISDNAINALMSSSSIYLSYLYLLSYYYSNFGYAFYNNYEIQV